MFSLIFNIIFLKRKHTRLTCVFFCAAAKKSKEPFFIFWGMELKIWGSIDCLAIYRLREFKLQIVKTKKKGSSHFILRKLDKLISNRKGLLDRFAGSQQRPVRPVRSQTRLPPRRRRLPAVQHAWTRVSGQHAGSTCLPGILEQRDEVLRLVGQKER